MARRQRGTREGNHGIQKGKSGLVRTAISAMASMVVYVTLPPEQERIMTTDAYFDKLHAVGYDVEV